MLGYGGPASPTLGDHLVALRTTKISASDTPSKVVAPGGALIWKRNVQSLFNHDQPSRALIVLLKAAVGRAGRSRRSEQLLLSMMPTSRRMILIASATGW
jgi:hypothetical protein